MNLTLTERDKKLLGLTACLAILAVFGVHLIRPALAEQEALEGEYEAARQEQQEYQAQLDARAALDDSIAQNEAALKTAGEPYYPAGLETRQMDDIITGLALKNGLFPQSLTLTEAVPGAVRAYLAVQEQADGSAAPAEGADQTGEAADETGEASDEPQTRPAKAQTRPAKRRTRRRRAAACISAPRPSRRRATSAAGCASSTRWSAAARGCA